MEFDLERIREILNMHREEIEKLKLELETTRAKYNALLEKVASMPVQQASQPLQQVIQQPSQEAKPKQAKEQQIQIDKFQLLLLLKNSRADNSSLAVSAQQLKDAFSIDKTVRTLHNKMLDLKAAGLIETIGKKPILYYLTQAGLNLVKQQESLLFR